LTPKTLTYGETQIEYGISFREPRRVVEFSLEVDNVLVRVADDDCKKEDKNVVNIRLFCTKGEPHSGVEGRKMRKRMKFTKC